ncbi:MAG: AAA family ATPase [Angustibacter sp.]
MVEDDAEPPVPITRLRVKNFRSLADVDVELGPLSVLIGPNGSGKTNILRALSFLSDVARFDVEEALIKWGGLENVQRAEADRPPEPIFFSLEGHFGGEFQGPYTLEISADSAGNLSVAENISHLIGHAPEVELPPGEGSQLIPRMGRLPEGFAFAGSGSTLLNLSSRVALLGESRGLIDLAAFLKKIYSFDVDVSAARSASPLKNKPLAADGSNLADALAFLRERDSDAWGSLLFDAQRCLSGLQDIELRRIGGAGPGVEVWLHESGIAPIPLDQASYGTVRLLALLCLLHEPDPQPLLVFDEFDHGLHPYAIDLLVDRLRMKSQTTQLIVTTHSPSFLNKLSPAEIIICGRDPDTSASIIPVLDRQSISNALEGLENRAGDMWYSGALGGVPE